MTTGDPREAIARAIEEAAQMMTGALKSAGPILEDQDILIGKGFVKGLNDAAAIARAAPLPTAYGWVAVGDGLPEPKDFVIAYSVRSGVTAANMCFGYDGSPIWYEMDGYPVTGVTHWQVMPPPPTEPAS